MPCTFCDAPVPAGARYCPSCGTGQTDSPVRDDPGFSWKKAGAARSEERSSRAWSASGEFGGWSGAATVRAPSSGVARSTCPSAIVSLVAGILGWSVLPVVGAVVAVIAGHVARREIDESRGRLDGDAMALVGLGLGYLQLVPLLGAFGLALVGLVFGVSAAALGGTVALFALFGVFRFLLGWL
jgi:hypothetical protein